MTFVAAVVIAVVVLSTRRDPSSTAASEPNPGPAVEIVTGPTDAAPPVDTAELRALEERGGTWSELAARTRAEQVQAAEAGDRAREAEAYAAGQQASEAAQEELAAAQAEAEAERLEAERLEAERLAAQQKAEAETEARAQAPPPDPTPAPEPTPDPEPDPEPEAPTPDPEPTTTPEPPAEPEADPESTDPPTAEQWARLRACESGGNYAIDTGNGYYGAYQFAAATWDWLAENHFPELLGMLPSEASPAQQDAMAFQLYALRGPAPWPTCGRHLL